MKMASNCNCNPLAAGKNGKSRNSYSYCPIHTLTGGISDDQTLPLSSSIQQVPMYVAVLTYFQIALMALSSYLTQMMDRIIFWRPSSSKYCEANREGYAPLYSGFEPFFTRHLFRYYLECANRPISSVPGAEIILKDRITLDKGQTFNFTGTFTKCLNVSSYNYLGFAENQGPCALAAEETTKELGLGVGSSRNELGTMAIHRELEKCVAKFLGCEDSITFGMGFATNALNLPALISKGSLVLSDEKNHASIILGLRLSGAAIRVFKHNDMKSLEEKLRQAVVEGQARTYRPWRKILIVVEGIYSMEGSIVNLPKVIELKKKYKAYLYLDEAHSIGAMGGRGRGIVDYFGCDPNDVDILMGTFTKSFGAAGGYIAGTKQLIDHLRMNSHAACYATSMSPPVAQQILSSMRIIMGEDGTDQGGRRLKRLQNNSRYFRQKLIQLGLVVLGNDDSPVIPVLLYLPSVVLATSRELLKRQVASVVVGYPATEITESRLRFCISASHSKEMLDQVIEAMDQVADLLHIRFSRLPRSIGPIIYGQEKLMTVDDID